MDNSRISFEDATALKPAKKKSISFEEATGQSQSRTFLGTAKDIGVTAAKTAVATGETLVGAADLLTKGYAGKALEKVGYDPEYTHQFLASGYSDAQQRANQEVEDAEGFIDTAKAMVKNPSTILHAIGESAGPMALGWGVGGKALQVGAKVAPGVTKGLNLAPKTVEKLGKWAPRLATAFGEGAVGASSAAESTRHQTEDGLLTGKQAGLSAASGFGTGVLSIVGSSLAKRLGFNDIDVLATKGFRRDLIEAGKEKAEESVPQLIAKVAGRIVGGGISEGAFEEMPQSAQEQMFANAALDRPLMEGVEEAAATGLLTGAAMGGGANVVSSSRNVTPSDTVDERQQGWSGQAEPAIAEMQRAFRPNVGESPDWMDKGTVSKIADKAGENEQILNEAETRGNGNQAVDTVQSIRDTGVEQTGTEVAQVEEEAAQGTQAEAERTKGWARAEQGENNLADMIIADTKGEIVEREKEDAEYNRHIQKVNIERQEFIKKNRQAALQKRLAQQDTTEEDQELETELSADARKEAEEITRSDPRYDIMAQIKRGGGMSLEQVRQMFSPETVSALSKKYPGLVQHEASYRHGSRAVSPDELAQEHGYDSANDMILDLANAPTIREMTSKILEQKRQEWEKYDKIAKEDAVSGPWDEGNNGNTKTVDIGSTRQSYEQLQAGGDGRPGYYANSKTSYKIDESGINAASNRQERGVGSSSKTDNDTAHPISRNEPSAVWLGQNNKRRNSRGETQRDNLHKRGAQLQLTQPPTDVQGGAESGNKNSTALKDARSAGDGVDSKKPSREKKANKELNNQTISTGFKEANLGENQSKGGDPASPDTTQVKGGEKDHVNKIEEIGGYVSVDNPGGSWLEGQVDAARSKDKPTGRRHGSLTGKVENVQLPVDMLLQFPGEVGEHERIKEGDERVNEIAKSIQDKGYNNDRAIFLNIGYNGDVVISEGNHRLRAAKQAGLKTIPVEIAYFAGGERRGVLSLGYIAEHATPLDGLSSKSKKKLDTDGSIQENSPAKEQVSTEPEKQPTVGDGAVSSAQTGVKDVNGGAKGEINIDSVQAVKDFSKRIDNNEVSLAEYSAAYKSFRDNKDTILAEIQKLKVKELKKIVGNWGSGYKKADYVDKSYNNYLHTFILSDAFTWSPFSETIEEAADKQVEKVTAEDLKAYSEKRQKQIEENRKRFESVMKSVKNPETLEEFETFIRVNGKDKLTDEQLTKYEQAKTDKGIEKKSAEQERKSTVQGVSGDVSYELAETHHAKKDIPLYVVKLTGERLPKEKFVELRSKAKTLGGWYSRYKAQGAIPGFQFESEGARSNFVDVLSGDTVKATDAIEEKVDKKKSRQAKRLKRNGMNLIKKGDEKLNQDRLTNTAKRAREAGYAEADARKMIATGKTMVNLANAVEAGEAKYINGVSAKTHIDLFDGLLSQAKYITDKDIPYRDQDRHRPPKEEDIKHVEYPYPSMDKSSLMSRVGDLEKINGAKMLAKRLEKTARALREGNRHSFINDIDDYRQMVKKLGDELKYTTVEDQLKRYDRLQRVGLTNEAELRTALREYLQFKDTGPKVDKVKELERSLVGANTGIDFFPTPKAQAKDIVDRAGIDEGMKVLEPSAGTGNLAEVMKEQGVKVDVAEISGKHREILKAKGFNVVEHDFMDMKDGNYDRIVMNPPFSKNMDIEHVRHAYNLLKPGGKLVAIMGEGAFFRQGKTETAFREWLDNIGTSEKLPKNFFMDRKELRTTGVNARVVEIDKPELRDQEMPKAEEYVTAKEHLDAVNKWRSETGNANAYEQKQEDRSDRYEERAAKLSQESTDAYNRAEKIGERFYMGQPIIVGHHSEKGARRDQERMHNATRKSIEADKKAGHAQGKADAVRSNKSISSDDEDAIIKLRAKLEKAEETQAQHKAINKALRKKDTAKGDEELKAMGLSEKAIDELRNPKESWQSVGIPSYRLSNNNANIRRMKQRLADLEAKSNDETKELEFDGGTVIDNVEDNRVQIDFDSKPDKETIGKLKSAGFKWAKSAGVWQRKRSTTATYLAETLTGIKFSKATTQSGISPKDLKQAGMEVDTSIPTGVINELRKYETQEIIPWKLRDDLVGREGEGYPKTDFAAAERFAEVFKKKIIWATIGEDYSINGFMVRNNSKLKDYAVIDVRSPLPMHSIFGHELTHHIESDSPRLFNELYRAISPLVKNHDRYRDIRNLQKLTEKQIRTEIVADFIGDNFTKPDFWEKLEKGVKKSQFKRLIDKIVKWIGNILNNPTWANTYESEKFITDLEKARGLAAQYVGEYGGFRNDKPAIFKPVDTNSKSFKKWFGSSRVVDEEGKPLVVYHSSMSDFSEFKGAEYRGAHFFSTSPDKAEHAATSSRREWAGENSFVDDGRRPKTYPVYLKAEKLYGESYVHQDGVPKVEGVKISTEEDWNKLYNRVKSAINSKQFSKDERVNEFAKKIALEEWRSFYDTEDNSDGSYTMVLSDKRAKSESRGEIGWEIFERGPSYYDHNGVGRKALQALGYDSAYISDEGSTEGAKTIAVFSPTQIKSAISNTGEFSKTNPDIRFSKATPKFKPVDTTTTAFKDWFGKSKITAGGKPHVLYHGTTHKRFLQDDSYPWEFDTNRAVNRGNSPLSGLGIFLGDETIASAHAMGGNGTAHPVYARVENPLITTAEDLEKKITSLEEASVFKKRAVDLNGHDGIILKDRGQVIAFTPNQVKSAAKNTGEFSRDNDDIRFSVAAADLLGMPPAEDREQAYADNRKKNRSIKAKTIRATKSAVNQALGGVDKFLGASSTRLRNIHKKLEAKVRELDFNTNTKHSKDIQAVVPLLNKAKKMSPSDFADWDFARKNSDKEKLDHLIEKYGMQEEYKVYRETMDRIRDEANHVGMDVSYIKNYSPRVIKDAEGFLKAVGKGGKIPVITQAIEERAKAMGIPVAAMPDEVKAEIISNMLFGGHSGVGLPGNVKERDIEFIPPELDQYYMDSDGALMHYLYNMRKHIEIRNFFGKMPKVISQAKSAMRQAEARLRKATKEDEEAYQKIDSMHILGEPFPETERMKGIKETIAEYRGILNRYKYERDYTENIGSYINDLINDGTIKTPEQEKVIVDVLRARFHERGTRGIAQIYKNLSYIDTMGNPLSAITQIGDLAWTLYNNGWIRTARGIKNSITNNSRIRKEDVGIERIAQEFADSDTLSNAVAKVFKWVGLEKIDSIGKEAMLNGALEKYESQAIKKPEKLKKDIKDIFENETESVIDDLQNKRITDNVKLLVYSRLLDFQPAGLSEMPEQYLLAGNGRLFYMLKSYTLKQFDVFRREVYNDLKNGDAKQKVQAMKRLVHLASLIVLANAGADEMKDFLLNRPSSFEDTVVDNILRLFGVSKYVTWKARTEGAGTAIVKQILPPFKFVDSLYKDVSTAGDEKGLQTVSSIPVVGKLAYWHMGRGSHNKLDYSEHRLRKEKNRLNRIADKVERDPSKRHLYVNELGRLKAANRLQSRLNRIKSRINKTIMLEKQTGRRYPERIKRLEDRREKLIERFLQ